MKNKAMVKNIVILFIAAFLYTLNTACAIKPPKIVDNVVSYFENLAFSSHEKSIEADQKYEGAIVNIDKLLAIARIVTGISLQAGLADESISVDQAITEFLNLEPVKLESLVEFSKKPADKLLEKLLLVKKSIKGETIRTEQAFIILDEIRELWRINSMEVKKLPTDLSTLDVVKKWNPLELGKFNVDETIRWLNAMLEKKQVDFQSLKSSLKMVIVAMSRTPSYEESQPIVTLLESIKPLEDFSRLMGLLDKVHLNELKIFSKEKEDIFSQNFDILKKLKLVSESNINVTRAAFNLKYSKPLHLVTIGFVNGADDLEKMVEDVHNINFMDSLLMNGVPLIGLVSVGKFKDELFLYEKKINPVLTDRHYKALRKAHLMSNELYTSPDELNAFTLQSNFETIREKIDWKVSIEEIISSSTYITTFHSDDYIKLYTEYLNCLLGVKGPIEKVAAFSRLIMNIRDLNLDSTNNLATHFDEMSSTISEAATVIPNIRQTGESIRKDHSNEVKDLMKLKEVKNYTKSLGNVAVVLATLKYAINKSEVFESFVKTGRGIQKIVHASESVEVQNAAKPFFHVFETTASKITKFLIQVEDFERKIRNLNGFNITLVASVLTELNKIDDVDFESETFLFAIEKISDHITDTASTTVLDDFRRDLGKLSKLELSFSNYHRSFSEMPDALKQIYDVFENARNRKEPLNTDTTRNTLITVGVLLFVFILLLIFWCVKDYRSPFWKFKNKYFKGKQTMRTAREGGVPRGGKVPKQESSVGEDGREKRRKTTSSQSEPIPPPPPPPPNPQPCPSNQPLSTSPPIPPPPPPPHAPASTVAPQPSLTGPSGKNEVAPNKTPRGTPIAPAPKTSTSKASVTKTSTTRSADNVSREKTKTVNKTQSVDGTNTKTASDNTKSTDAEGETMPDRNISGMKKGKREQDTLAQPDSTDKTHKTVDTEKYTFGGENTLNECPSDIYNNEKHPISDGKETSLPPEPRKKESKKKEEQD
ncbi:unnamed protein product [Caenorhabditis brenneri]